LGNTFARAIAIENIPHLYDTLVLVLSQHAQWVDPCHLKTVVWRMVGLIQSSWMRLRAWVPRLVCYSRQASCLAHRCSKTGLEVG
jgi:hypothetical protein